MDVVSPPTRLTAIQSLSKLWLEDRIWTAILAPPKLAPPSVDLETEIALNGPELMVMFVASEE